MYRYFNQFIIVISILFILFIFIYTTHNCEPQYTLIDNSSHYIQIFQHTPINFSLESYPRLPDVIIIGVKKAGTKAIESFLNTHDNIIISPGEVHFYDQNLNKGLSWYLKRLPPARDDQLLIDRTPAYFTSGPQVPRQIKTLKGDTKLILIVREPVNRFVSDFLHFQNNLEQKDRISFEEYVFYSNSSQILKTMLNSTRLDRSCYSKHLKLWLDIFPPNQLHVVNGDRLIVEPWVEVASLDKFLGLPNVLTKERFIFNTSKGFFCWQGAEMTECLPDAKGRPHPNIPLDKLGVLTNYFKECNRNFYKQMEQAGKHLSLNWII